MIETTLAGVTYLRRLREAARQGWRVNLLYFSVATPEIALARIARRVSEGGHDVQEAEARRRFERSIGNLPLYLGLAEMWRVFDNNGPRPLAVAEGRAGCISYSGALDRLPDALATSLAALPGCEDN